MSQGLTSAMPKFRTVHHQVIQVLGQEVASGRIPVGDTLPPEPALCEQLGVSRGALREAVKALAAKGMLELRPRTGTRVLPLSEWNLLDGDVLSWLLITDRDSLITHLTEVRSLIEPGAAGFAAQRATKDEGAELLAAYRAMESAGSDPSTSRFIDADVHFHQVLLRISHNPLLAALNRPLEIALHASFETTSAAPGARPSTLSLHLHVAEAVAAGDPAKARESMGNLIRISAHHFQEVRR
jgi:DNA-binding FadR family transcriptional regulator